MPFKDIAGHKAQISFLQSAVASGRVSHAYLFAGASGIGKKMVALAFAGALNCAAAPAERPCGACVSCVKISGSNHPDVAVIVPEEDKPDISIDQVRELARKVSLKPLEGSRKVFILDGAGSMGYAAQNALLKTLEEPARDTTIILIADNPGALAGTVVSRSQMVRFFPLRPPELEKLLAGRFGVDAKKAKALSRLARGSVAEAIALNESGYFERRSRVIDMLKSRDSVALDEALESAPKGEVKRILETMLAWYRDVLLAKAGASGEDAFMNADRAEAIMREAAGRDSRYLEEAIGRIVDTISYLDMDANRKLALSVLASRL